MEDKQKQSVTTGEDWRTNPACWSADAAASPRSGDCPPWTCSAGRSASCASCANAICGSSGNGRSRNGSGRRRNAPSGSGTPASTAAPSSGTAPSPRTTGAPRASRSCASRYAESFDPSDPGGLLLWGGCGHWQDLHGLLHRQRRHRPRLLRLPDRHCGHRLADGILLRGPPRQSRPHPESRPAAHRGPWRGTLAPNTCWAIVYNVIDGRYRSGKPMVITTNIPLKDIYQPSASSPWQRIFDRITERCYPIEFTGASRPPLQGRAHAPLHGGTAGHPGKRLNPALNRRLPASFLGRQPPSFRVLR